MARMRDLDVVFGDRCKAIRELRRMSQQKLADAAGVHQSAISKIEAHERGVTLTEAIRICETLLIPLGDMVADGEVRIAVVS